MKQKLLICLLVLAVAFTGCTSSYYVTSQGSPNRHQGYRKQSDNFQRDGYYYRGGMSERAARRNFYMRRYYGW